MRTILISFLVLGTTLVHAQFSLRPQMGFNTANFRSADRGDYFEERVGFQFGVDAQIGRSFYLQPGIFWESSENEIYQEIDQRENTVSVERIRIPVMLGYKLAGNHTSGWLNARVFTGPNVSFNVSKDLGDDPLFDDDDYRNSTWGWNVGFGLDLAFLFVDAGYQFGLDNVFDGIDGTANNDLFYGNVGLRIGF
ncbi:MAG: PorT family protein [Saprospiraceae bacterium]|nr:PorT family protein [Saprospiraceae bacterium]